MSSRSRPKPQPASLAPSLEGAAPEYLVTEVPAAEAAGASRTEGAAAHEATVTSLADAAQKRRPPLASSPAVQPSEDSPVAAPAKRRGAASIAAGASGEATTPKAKAAVEKAVPGPEVKVRRMHRRDLNRTWEFLKLVFRDVNRETVEYQRPRSKRRFFEVYEEEG